MTTGEKLASLDNQPKLKPFGMIYSDLITNPQIEIASYNLDTRRWIRIHGRAETESSILIKEEMINIYPLLKSKFCYFQNTY